MTVPEFWVAYSDIINAVPPELTSAVYWDNIRRLANLPILTMAAIRDIGRTGGAQIATALDIT